MARLTAALLAALAVASPAYGLYTSSSPVIQLTDANFEKQVVKGDGVWMVEFYAPWCGHCKSLTPEWEKAAKASKGVVNIAAVDATAHQSVASKYSIQGFPTIMVFGLDKSKPDKYEGGRTADAIVSAGLKAAQDVVKTRLSGKKPSSGGSSGGSKSSGSSDVITLTEDNFEEIVLNSNDPVMVEFYAPWCGHCKNLAPEWEKAATEMKGVMKMGALDATVHGSIAQKYGVNGYPTLKFFAPGAKDQPSEINAGRTASALVDWGMAKLDELGVGPEVTEIADQAGLDECMKKLCTIAVLPHLIDGGAKQRNDYIATLKAVLKKARGKSVNIGWIQGGLQENFENTFRLAGLGYPAAVVVSKSKKRYAVHKGTFSDSGLGATVIGVASGNRRMPTQEFKVLPPFNKVTAWDGEEYVPSEE